MIAWRRTARRTGRRLQLATLDRVVFGGGRLVRTLAARRLADDAATAAALFDPEFYLRQIPAAARRRAAARDPVLHYLLIGRRRLLAPHPGFDPRHYRDANPDLPRRCDPLLHYLRRGMAEGRSPCHLPPAAAGDAGRPETEARGTALLFDHARGGGSTRYLDGHERRLHEEGYATLRVRRVPCRTPLFVVDAAPGAPDALRFFAPETDEARFLAFARAVGTRRIVVNHMIDLPASAFDWFPRVAAAAGAVYEVLLHDYYLACPRTNLVAHDGRYCGLPPVSVCACCIARGGSEAGRVDPAAWRARSERFLAGAERIIAPSADLAHRLGAALPAARITVIEPEPDDAWPPERRPLPAPPPLRVAVLGALNVPKGYEVVRRLARTVARRQLPIELVVIGAAVEPGPLARLGVRIEGRFREAEIPDLLDRHAPHLAFLPSIWPETWSFALSLALRHGLPVVAFDLGAIAERLRRLGRGTLLAPSLAEDPAALAAALLDAGARLASPAAGVPAA